MSLRTGRKKSKANDWSEWGWDKDNFQWYRTRYDSKDRYRYTSPATISWQLQYDLAQTEAQTTPRSEAGVQQYESDESSQTYFENKTYRHETSPEEVDALSGQLESTSLGSRESPLVAYSPLYVAPTAPTWPSQESTSIGYTSTARPIDVPMSASRSTTSGSRAYSSSAPAYTTNYKGKAIDTEPGYFPEEAAGFIQGTYDKQQGTYEYRNASPDDHMYFSPTSDTATSSTYHIRSNHGAQDMTEGTDVDDSGAITPKIIHKEIRATKGETEKLDSRFKIHSSKYFKPGHVFKVVWSEPEGETRPDGTEVTPYSVGGGKFGESVHTTVRRFIIVAADHGHCQCLPILTYQRQGSAKYGIKRDDHAIVYIGQKPSEEVNREEGLTRPPIELIPKTYRDKLEAKSLINYAKIYTVEHNVKVLFIGRIAQGSEAKFTLAFDDTWNKKRHFGGSGY